MRSFEHLCGGREIILQYGDIVRSFPKDIAILTKRVCRTEQEQVFVAMECTDQVKVSTFVELKLLWHR